MLHGALHRVALTVAPCCASRCNTLHGVATWAAASAGTDDGESWSRCASPGSGRARKGAEGRACSGTRRAGRPHAREATLTAAANHRAHRSVHTKSGIEDVVSVPFSSCAPSGCNDAPKNLTCAENTTCSARRSRYRHTGVGWPPRVGKRSGRLAVMTRLMLRRAVRKRRQCGRPSHPGWEAEAMARAGWTPGWILC